MHIGAHISRKCSRKRPVCLGRLIVGVDDAHCLDEASAAVILQLAVTTDAFLIITTRSGEPAEDPRARADADAHPDDPDADGGDLDTTELLQRELGAQVIEETPNK